MKVNVTKTETKEHDLKEVRVFCHPRYWEDTSINGVEDTEGDLIPFREGEALKFTIDIDLGKIKDWPSDKEAKIHYKVCDRFSYSVINSDGDIVKTEEDEYMPNFMPNDHYGDYLIMNIDNEGNIENWKPNFDCLSDDEY